ncbi:MAG: 7,8-dihydroneopterin aldolase [Thermonema sp.]|jgi:dihydroneopterin aldolase|uniref:dihydroneopterin aldolase n=1 Tax=Thermonema sp. TaxID=2231181 RepID=UPI0021DEE6C7|nr:dihydroneopterin aldolase [Thermonema sp.]GIV39667.1 MAG: 7,8-dihydroneopterin aldolase [Thermonema sp.]
MGEISLENMEFFAYHGFYDEEQKIGNKYSVDLRVWVDFHRAALEDQLRYTVNYEKLYRLVAEVMATPTRLLEHLAQRIAQEVLQHFQMVEKVEVSVAKHNPPIGGVCAKARVRLSISRDRRQQ